MSDLICVSVLNLQLMCNATIDEGILLRADGILGPVTEQALVADYETAVLAMDCGIELPSLIEVDSMSTTNRKQLRKLAKIFIKVSRKTGIDVNWMIAFARIESSFRTTATNGSSRGLFQFQPKAWKDAAELVDIGDYQSNWDDPYYNSLAMAAYLKINLSRLRQLGVDASKEPRWLYLAHQQGASGLVELIKANNGQRSTDYVTEIKMLKNVPKGHVATTDKARFYRNWMNHLSNYFK